MNNPPSLVSRLKSLLLAVTVAAVATIMPASVSAADWIVDGNTVTFADQVGFTPDGSKFSGTVALRMENVTISGQFKILTTIVSIIPEPGFTYTVKKSGGYDATVEIEFKSANGASKFSFLYKPGLTKIDYGVLRLR